MLTAARAPILGWNCCDSSILQGCKKSQSTERAFASLKKMYVCSSAERFHVRTLNKTQESISFPACAAAALQKLCSRSHAQPVQEQAWQASGIDAVTRHVCSTSNGTAELYVPNNQIFMGSELSG